MPNGDSELIAINLIKSLVQMAIVIRPDDQPIYPVPGKAMELQSAVHWRCMNYAWIN